MATFNRAIYLVGCKRTPFGTFGGKLRDHTPPQLQEIASKAALTAGNVKLDSVDSVIIGSVMQWVSKDTRGIARQSSLRIGIPQHVPALIVNRQCGSGFQSMINGAQDICLSNGKIPDLTAV